MSDEAPLGGGRYIVDTSAWIKLHRCDAGTLNEFTRALQNGQLATCPIVLLERLRGERPQQFDQADARLRSVFVLPTTEKAIDKALVAQADIARAHPDGLHQKLPPGDLLIAATAALHGFGVLHYDADFDVLCEAMPFDSRWLAERGSLA